MILGLGTVAVIATATFRWRQASAEWPPTSVPDIEPDEIEAELQQIIRDAQRVVMSQDAPSARDADSR
jgi:hypothetical protein